MLRVAVGLVAALLMVVGGPGPARGQSSGDPLETVSEFGRRITTGDRAGAMDLLADDVVIRFAPCFELFGPDGCVGKDQAARAIELVIGAEAEVVVLEQAVSGDTVTQRREVTSSRIRAAGVDRVVETVVFEVRDGRIAYEEAQLDASDEQTARFLAERSPSPASTGNLGLAAGSYGAVVAEHGRLIDEALRAESGGTAGLLSGNQTAYELLAARHIDWIQFVLQEQLSES